MSIDSFKDEQLTKEERRRIEIAERLQELRLVLPYVERGYRDTGQKRKELMDEIKTLEDERLALNQGQLVFDVNF